jgi:hypothetical protein
MADPIKVSGSSTVAAAAVADDAGVQVANPLRAGARLADSDRVSYYKDGTIDFTVDGGLWNVGDDGRGFKAVGGDWAEQKPIPAAVRDCFAKLRALDPSKQTSPAVAPTAAASTRVAAGDALDKGAATGKTADVETRLDALERQNVELQGELDKAKKAREADEAKAAERARNPGFGRMLLEICEALGRFMSPILNIVSACVRLLRVGYELLTGQKVDWLKEGLRMAGDIAGIFFPPAGAIANTAFNLWFDESEMLGGINEIFDKAKVKNQMRFEAVEVWNGVTGFAKDIWQHIAGHPGVAQGSQDDDGVTPLSTVAPTEVQL